MCVAILNKILYYNATTYAPNALSGCLLPHKIFLFVTSLFIQLLRVGKPVNCLSFSGKRFSCSIQNEWFRMVGEFA